MSVRRSIRVLHVDDEVGFCDLVETCLGEKGESFEVVTETDPGEALSYLESNAVDCVVSDYSMPGMDGLELLEAVREAYPDLPFILCTGTGTEDIASRAISAGVTDYIQKGGGTDQYTVLANRIENAVKRRERDRQYETLVDNLPGFVYRSPAVADLADEVLAGDVEDITGYTGDELAGQEPLWSSDIVHPGDADGVREELHDQLEASDSFELTYRVVTKAGETRWVWERGEQVGVSADGEPLLEGFVSDITGRRERERELERHEQFVEYSPDFFVLLDAEMTIEYQSPMSPLSEWEPLRATGDSALEYIHDDDHSRVARQFEALLSNPDEIASAEYRLERSPGEWRWVESRAQNFLGEDPIDGVLATLREITERKENELELQRQNERLDEFARVVSHDLQNPLNVAGTRLDVAVEETGNDHVVGARQSLERMEQLIDDLLRLARQGQAVGDTEPVQLCDLVTRCWENVQTGDARVEIATNATISADDRRLRNLLENLFHNAVEHGSEDVTVTIGTIDGRDGFYVADDGVGIPEDEREQVFEGGYSTRTDGTGFGLAIVEQIADAHGWEVRITDSEAGGARFEITGVDTGDGRANDRETVSG